MHLSSYIWRWPAAVIVNRVPWGRTWINRGTYVQPYGVPRYAGPRPPERHRLMAGTEHDRAVPRAARRNR